MKFDYKDSPYEVPDGRYLCIFTGVEPHHNPKAIGSDGYPIPPGLRWNFKVADGEQKGKLLNCLSGKVPTAKNACGRMLRAIFNDEIEDNDSRNTDERLGHFYWLRVSDGYIDNNRPPKYMGPPNSRFGTDHIGKDEASNSMPIPLAPGDDGGTPF